MTAKPIKSSGFWVGLLVGVLFFGTFIWGVNFSLGPDQNLLRILLLIPAILILILYFYLMFGLVTMRYEVNDQELILHWALTHRKVKLEDIVEIVLITGPMNIVNFLGASWPGYIVGTYELRGVATTKFFGTDTREIVVIKTHDAFYAITPTADFLDEFSLRADMPVEHLDMFDVDKEIIGKIVNEDLIYMIMYGLNIVLIFALAAYLAIFFPGSGADKIVFLLLSLGVGIFAFNMVNASRLYSYVSVGAYMLWLVQLTINLAFLVIAVKTVGF